MQDHHLNFENRREKFTFFCPGRVPTDRHFCLGPHCQLAAPYSACVLNSGEMGAANSSFSPQPAFPLPFPTPSFSLLSPSSVNSKIPEICSLKESDWWPYVSLHDHFFRDLLQKRSDIDRVMATRNACLLNPLSLLSRGSWTGRGEGGIINRWSPRDLSLLFRSSPVKMNLAEYNKKWLQFPAGF